MIVREKWPEDQPWIEAFLRQRWGGTISIVHGEEIDAAALPALVAGEREGLATYRVRNNDAELVSLDAVTPGWGVGTVLVTALSERLGRAGVKRLWVTTTNDNVRALGFYQKRGFALQMLHPGAIGRARQLKPAIPLLGEEGIPLRDEIDLCLAMT